MSPRHEPQPRDEDWSNALFAEEQQWECPYCFKHHISYNGTGSDVACCGEIGHSTPLEQEQEPDMNKTMPTSFESMTESKFLRKEDFESPRVLTIKGFDSENVAPQGEPPENKWILYFTEEQKPLVLNSTNIAILKAAFGSPSESIGQRIQVYCDPNVSFGGKLVGGIRLRGPSKKPSQAAKPMAVDDFADDLPF